jgi:hypothetical protein
VTDAPVSESAVANLAVAAGGLPPCQLAADRQASLLPKQLLHSQLADKVFFSFARGKYDNAMLQAFKQVEVAVGEAGKLGASEYGDKLMRAALRPDEGSGSPS